MSKCRGSFALLVPIIFFRKLPLYVYKAYYMLMQRWWRVSNCIYYFQGFARSRDRCSSFGNSTSYYQLFQYSPPCFLLDCLEIIAFGFFMDIHNVRQYVVWLLCKYLTTINLFIACIFYIKYRTFLSRVIFLPFGTSEPTKLTRKSIETLKLCCSRFLLKLYQVDS